MTFLRTKPPTRGESTILVVDDNEAMTAFYSSVLEHDGFSVMQAVSAREALFILDMHRPDLIVLDLMMPEMGGHELLERIRSGEKAFDVPVIFLTAAGDDDAAIERAFSLGASDYLVKPVNRRILIERVRATIAQAKEHTVLRAVAHERHETERLRSELGEAKAMQQAQLPQTPIQCGPYRLIAALRPCKDVGGDIYDVVDAPDGSKTVVVVDVSGHGLSAAMVATAVRGLLRLLLRTMPPDVALCELNHQLCENDQSHYACVALVRVGQNAIEVVNGGLPPVTVFGETSYRYVTASGSPPGLVPGATYEKFSTKISNVKRVVLVTDGLTEPFGLADQVDSPILELGLHSESSGLSPAELDRRIALMFQRRGVSQPDDATVLSLETALEGSEKEGRTPR